MLTMSAYIFFIRRNSPRGNWFEGISSYVSGIRGLVSDFPLQRNFSLLLRKGVIMSSKLWFVTNGAQLIGVFNNRDSAEREMKKYQDDPDYPYYDFYDLSIDELDDYPEEYDIALDEGYVG